jgi:hypothetical protein
MDRPAHRCTSPGAHLISLVVILMLVNLYELMFELVILMLVKLGMNIDMFVKKLVRFVKYVVSIMYAMIT